MSQKLQTFISDTLPFAGTKAGQIASHFKEREILKNDYLLKEGKVCCDYLFLESGFMRAFAIDVEGNDITTAFYSGGQIVFEAASYFRRSPAKENIQALTDCVGWFITFDELQHLFHSMPEFREFGRMIIINGFVALKERMLSLISETAEDRYAHLIQSRPDIFQYAPLKTIASYLGVTDTSLSRIRREFANR